MRKPKQENYQIKKGKPARFPIMHTVVVSGEDRNWRLDAGDETRCWKCGEEFAIRPDNTESFPNGMEYSKCPRCGIKISALECYKRAVYRQFTEVEPERDLTPKARRKQTKPKRRNKRSPFFEYIIRDEAAMPLYKNGFSDRAMAKALGCSPRAVQDWRSRNFLVANWGKKVEE